MKQKRVCLEKFRQQRFKELTDINKTISTPGLPTQFFVKEYIFYCCLQFFAIKCNTFTE